MSRSTGSPASATSGLLRLGSLPIAAAVLVALNGLYIALVAFGNITDFGTNQAFVRHVLTMDTTNFGAEPGTNLDPDVMWRAITNETLQDIAYVAIIAWETLTALVLIAAVIFWARERGRGYRSARALSTLGLLMLTLLFLGGFIAIGGEWFQMWKSDAWNGLDPAFRNAVLALLALVLLHIPSPHWVAD
jgi:predicted small integral membrane protein